jgi:TetR/AcrR family transcriptional regulator
MVKFNDTDSLTQQKIFRAATDVFEEKGYAGARMQEIADRAGINKALLHYYFRSKDQLFKSVFQVLLSKMFEKIISLFKEDLSFKEKIRRFFDQHIDFLIKNPDLPLFLLNEISRNPSLVQGLKDTIPYDKLREMIYTRHAKELKGYGIKEADMIQLMISVVSFSVFPFAARDMLKMLIPQMADNKKFNSYMNKRKEFAADFVITALKNRKK